jgi:hypothetical protein
MLRWNDHYPDSPPLQSSPPVQEIGNTTRERGEKILVSLNWGIVCQTLPYKLI